MRKALFVTLVLLVQFAATSLFAADENRGYSSLKYNYVVETNLTLNDFSQAFIERIREKHNWNEVLTNTCSDETCVSTWNFTDDEAHKWKCEVVIKKSDVNSNAMVVSMEMNPVLGS
jgi:hypothetical protein